MPVTFADAAAVRAAARRAAQRTVAGAVGGDGKE